MSRKFSFATNSFQLVVLLLLLGGIGCSNLTKEQDFQKLYDKLNYVQNGITIFDGLSGKDTQNKFESYIDANAPTAHLSQLRVGSVLVSKNEHIAKMLVQEVSSQGFTFQYVLYDDNPIKIITQGLATLTKEGGELKLGTIIKIKIESSGKIEVDNSSIYMIH